MESSFSLIIPEGQYGCEDMLPHRKRLHMMPGYDVLTPVLQAQNLGLQS